MSKERAGRQGILEKITRTWGKVDKVIAYGAAIASILGVTALTAFAAWNIATNIVMEKEVINRIWPKNKKK